MKKILLLLLITLFYNCSNNPEPINYGHDSCDKCRMQIVDPKYGTELVTSKGKIYKFDSIECLAFFSSNINRDSNSTIWVTDFLNNNELIKNSNAYYLRSEKLNSPMGLNLTAFSSEKQLNNTIEKYNGKELSWKEIINYVNKEWQN